MYMMNQRQWSFLLAIFGPLLTMFYFPIFCSATETFSVKHYTLKILRTFPHSSQSFTQGLLYHNGVLYESTGLRGRSSLQKIDPRTGDMLKRLPVPGVFAEGLACWEDRLIQLTWQNRFAFIYTLADFSPVGLFQYDTEGWGLTADDRHLIMSDGTDTIFFRHPLTFDVERTLQVTFDGKPLYYLNELEYADGLLYANIWHENYIVQIDPAGGNVVGLIDAAPLFRALPPLHEEHGLNGIAYNAQTQTFYLTGKNWPKIFEVILEE